MLSAIGALLTALGEVGDSQDVALPAPPTRVERALPRSAIPPTRPGSARPAPQLRDPRTDYSAPITANEPVDEVGALLADARLRAEEIIEDSIARAEELLRPQAGDTRLRAAVADVAADVRGLHRRLDTIERLLRAGSLVEAQLRSFASPAPAPASPVAPIEPTTAPPTLSIPPTEPAASAAPPSALPPRLDPTPAAAPPEAAAPAPPALGFDPAGGALTLRVSPVAGFQALMRVQDALVRVQGVKEAGVEAYAQGEARLRLHLSAHLDPQLLASTLGAQLGRAAQVAAVSIAERTIQLALE